MKTGPPNHKATTMALSASMQAMDTNRDGRISFEEFSTYFGRGPAARQGRERPSLARICNSESRSSASLPAAPVLGTLPRGGLQTAGRLDGAAANRDHNSVDLDLDALLSGLGDSSAAGPAQFAAAEASRNMHRVANDSVQ